DLVAQVAEQEFDAPEEELALAILLPQRRVVLEPVVAQVVRTNLTEDGHAHLQLLVERLHQWRRPDIDLGAGRERLLEQGDAAPEARGAVALGGHEVVDGRLAGRGIGEVLVGEALALLLARLLGVVYLYPGDAPV